MAGVDPRLVHFHYDTLPRVVGSPGSATVELRVPFRIETDPAAGLRVISWRLIADVDGRPWTVRSRAHRITEALCALLRPPHAAPGPVQLRPGAALPRHGRADAARGGVPGGRDP